MKIDYLQNPLAITKLFTIPYGEGLHLEGRIIAHIEEGFDEVTWFHGEVGYPANERRKHFTDFRKNVLGGSGFYQDLLRGAQSEFEVEEKMKNFIGSLGFEISQVKEHTLGVARGNPVRDLEMLQLFQERNYF
ncbi:MAG: hypothetical protein AABY03_02105 [Nanoarchaeota archaeon]